MTRLSGIRAGEAFFSLALGGPFSRQLRQFQRSLRGLGRFGQGLQGLGANLNSVALRLNLVGAAMGGLVLRGVRLAAANEQVRVSYRTLIGEADKADKLLAKIADFSARTPLRKTDLQDAGRLLLAFGFSAGEVIPTLERLGNIGAGTNNSIGELAELFGKARVQGRLFAEDVNQFTGRGVPVIQELSKILGITQDKLKEAVKDGKVGFAELDQAIRNLTEGEGSRFGGLLAAQSETASGVFSTLRDNLDAVQQTLGEALLPTVNQFLRLTIRHVRELGEWVKMNSDLIPQYAALGLKIGAVVLALPAIGTAMSAAGAAVSAGAAVMSTAIGTLLGPAAPLALLAAAIAGIGAQMPGVRAAFATGMADIRTTTTSTIGGIAAALKDGTLEDAMMIAMAGVRVAFRQALNAMEIAYLEFLQGFEQKLDELTTFKIRVGESEAAFQPFKNAVEQTQRQIDALRAENERMGREDVKAIVEQLRQKREEERTAAAAEQLVDILNRGIFALPVVP